MYQVIVDGVEILKGEKWFRASEGEEHASGPLRIVTNQLDCRRWSRKSHTWADEGIELAECCNSDGCVIRKARAGIQAQASGPTNVVAGPFSRFRRQAHAEEAPPLCAQASRVLPREERALWEAAIQLDLVTLNKAEAQVTEGRTVAAWMAAQAPGAGNDRKGHPWTSFERALLLALVMFNGLVLVAFATAIVWIVRLFL